jgi:hypothetical protein
VNFDANPVEDGACTTVSSCTGGPIGSGCTSAP